MKKNYSPFIKLLVALFVSLLLIALFFSIVLAPSLFAWHPWIGYSVLCLVPIHVALHFKKLKKLILESLAMARDEETQAEKKERIVRHIKHDTLKNFAVWIHLEFHELAQYCQTLYRVTIRPEETMAELSRRTQIEVFSLFLAIIDLKLQNRS